MLTHTFHHPKFSITVMAHGLKEATHHAVCMEMKKRFIEGRIYSSADAKSQYDEIVRDMDSAHHTSMLIDIPSEVDVLRQILISGL